MVDRVGLKYLFGVFQVSEVVFSSTIYQLSYTQNKTIYFAQINNILFKHGDGFVDWDQDIKYDGVICAAAPRQYPQDLIESLNVDSKIVIPVGNSKLQQLNVITKLSDKIEEDIYDEVAFVPMLPGVSMDGNDS